MMNLKHFIKKLQQCFYDKQSNLDSVRFDEDVEHTEMVPGDVKKGHFAVTTIKGEEKKRFIVELLYLSNPAFAKLLEQAREEYGFLQKGVLCVPCLPVELQNILAGRKNKSVCSES